MPTHSPPLTVWLYSVLMFLSVLGTAYVFVPSPPHVEDNVPERLTAPPPSSHTFRVVLIGTSLTGWGFHDSVAMEAIAQAEGMTSLEFFRMAKTGRNLGRLHALFEALKTADPDLVLIEEKLLCYADPSPGQLPIHLQRVRGFLQEIIKGRIMPTPALPNHSFITDSMVHEWLKKAALKEKATDYQAAASMVRIRREFPPHRALHQFLVHARTQGVPVILLGLPFAQPVEALYPTQERNHERAIRQRYKDTYGTGYLAFTDDLGEDHFADLFHANLKGRERLSAWLIGQLRAWAP